MTQDDAVRQAIHALLREQQLGVLSTIGENAPYASLVAYAVSDDDRFLYFVTPRATRKFANLSAIPQVALLINNSINRPEDFHRAMAVTATATGASDPAVRSAMAAEFFDACPTGSADTYRQLLSLARASYRLRDDDNIILGAIEAQLIAVAQEGRRRAAAGSDVVAEALAATGLESGEVETPAKQTAPPAVVRDRQITGQPAGPGLARGTARVILRHSDIAGFNRGEVIVCDAVDPNMTFVMPLAAGIIERRGGMLIHGAIIAREYGLPCVTGVAEATERIRTGQPVTVDGYLGIVTLGEC